MRYSEIIEKIPARVKKYMGILQWVSDWLGVNTREEKHAMVAKWPKGVTIPWKYRTLSAGTKLYRGMVLNDEDMQSLLQYHVVELEGDAVASFSLSRGVAHQFAVGNNSVIIEKEVKPDDVIVYIPAILDDMAWLGVSDEMTYQASREEYAYFEREQEVLVRDNAYYRTIRLEDCVFAIINHDKRNPRREIEQSRAKQI